MVLQVAKAEDDNEIDDSTKYMACGVTLEPKGLSK